MSNKRRTAGVHSRPRLLGPNGERICYNCRGPLPKGKRFNCSPKCSEEWAGKTSPGIMRSHVFKRDKGICALCRCDTVALRAEWEGLPRTKLGFLDEGKPDPRRDFLRAHGIPHSRAVSRWWFDADHITPVIEGGGECGLDNFRTLCIPCHKKVTADLRKRLADVAKAERIEKKDAARGLFQNL